MSEKVRYGIIGFGGIAENRISREGFSLDRRRFAPNPDADLVCATDINPGRKPAAEALGLRWHENAESLLADPDIQAVVVTTDNLSHGPVAEKALTAGKHCLIEKPIATTIQEARKLQAIARKASLSLAVDHMMRENAFNRRAAELVASGALGKVNDIVLHMEFLYGADEQERRTWRCSDPDQLGGPLGDVGSHCLYMAEFLTASAVSSIACTYIPKTLPIAVEDGAYISFTCANGMQGSARVAFNCARGGLAGMLSNLGYEIYGTEAVLRGYGTVFQLSGHRGEPIMQRLEMDRAGEVRPVRPGETCNIYQAVIRNHARSILENAPLTGADGAHNLDLVLKCHESARQGGKIIEVGA